MQFGPLAALRRAERGEPKPETFNFLGFTHICGKTRNGGYKLLRHTIKKRMTATLKALKEELRRRYHLPIPDQGAWLMRKLRGYYHYFAVRTNSGILGSFRTQVERLWLRTPLCANVLETAAGPQISVEGELDLPDEEVEQGEVVAQLRTRHRISARHPPGKPIQRARAPGNIS